MQFTNRKHAVVIGASMGGLLAARALSDHFESVTIIDRDQMPAVGESREIQALALERISGRIWAMPGMRKRPPILRLCSSGAVLAIWEVLDRKSVV